MRFGIIGTNWITDRFIAGASLHERFELAAVYSRTEEKAREFADKHAIPGRYTDVEEMAASGNIDALYIASPNSLHAEQAIAAMKRGIHVLCEKPIASNSRELEKMIAAAREHNVLLMEAVKSTTMPGFGAIRDNLKELGPVRRYMASFCQYSSRYDAYKAGTILNAFKPEFSNGALMDIGIYCIYPAFVLFGKPKAIKANGLLLESGVDGEGSILMEYDGMEAVLMYSKISSSQAPSEIQGEAGNMIIRSISEPAQLELQYRNGSTKDLSRPTMEHNMYYEVEEFIRTVEEGRRESAVNSFAVSLEVMRIMDEARRQIGLIYPADGGTLCVSSTIRA
ncbi:Gfo/Idh/MocA family oxidoreductase [Paenibacillus sp. HB172176]|uniref:Gfo/Idh/MocA family protein n=1 Tax=Paenibacillus sp. HB172176 TaxID=2493690 RepID=UPI00143933E5|nr:Gfo/Idh/MocA family oxidoreductase [Paenibacillus sp. HB172176]